MVFFEAKKCRSLGHMPPLNFNGYSFESRRLEDDDFGLSFEDESDFEGKGIYGYMPVALV